MRRRIFSILLVGFLLIACALQFVQAQDRSEPSARQVLRQRGVPITSLLRSGETQLTIVSARRTPPLLVEPPPGKSAVAWKTQNADVVMVARVESRQSKLTAEEDWINTSVQIKILQVLKSTGRRSFSVGERVSFMEEGGSLEIAGQQVDAIVEWASRFEVGKEYLIFAYVSSNNELKFGAASAYEIVPGRSLRSLFQPKQSDSLPEISLDNVLDEVQSNADVVE